MLKGIEIGGTSPTLKPVNSKTSSGFASRESFGSIGNFADKAFLSDFCRSFLFPGKITKK